MALSSSIKRWQWISAFFILAGIILLIWRQDQLVHRVDANKSSRDDISEKRNLVKTEQSESFTSPPPTIDIYQYIEEQPAGKGSSSEELKRIRHFLATQGTVCENLKRVGGAGKGSNIFGPDGAWDTCFDVDVGLVPKSCIVYSFGIANDFSFDDGMAHYGCYVYSFDPTTGRGDHQHSERVKFFNTGLSDRDQEGNGKAVVNAPRSDWKTRTLASVMKDLHHNESIIDVVKMDIEGSEWSSLPQMLKDGTLHKKVRQLIAEFHLTNEPSQLRRYYSIIQWLTRQGIKVCGLHQNPYCPPCLEITFINTKLRENYKKSSS